MQQKIPLLAWTSAPVAILLGCSAGLLAAFALGWPWYGALCIGLLVAAVWKVIFRTARPPAQPPAKRLEQSVTMLRVGIFTLLCRAYLPAQGEQQAKLLAAAVLSHALDEEPANDEEWSYLAANSNLILNEAMKLSSDLALKEAFSFLYAAQIMHLACLASGPLLAQAKALSDRATQLSIYVPDLHDLSPGGDASGAIDAIAAYATRFALASAAEGPIAG